MTEAEAEPAPRRDGTEADIAGMRIYYRGPDGIEQHVDWDRRLMVSEAVALKKTAQVVPRQALAAVVDYFADPDATRAVVWMLRKFRRGEADLKLLQVDVDLVTIHDEWIDGDGVELDLPKPQERPDLDSVTAALVARYPDIDPGGVEEIAALILAALPEPEPDPEGQAGGEPAEQPSSPTT